MVVGQGPNHEHVEHGVTEQLEPLIQIGRYVSNHGQMHDGFMLNPWIGEMVVDQELKLSIVILWYCEAIGRRDKIKHWAQMFNIWEKNMCTLDRPRQFPVKAAPGDRGRGLGYRAEELERNEMTWKMIEEMKAFAMYKMCPVRC